MRLNFSRLIRFLCAPAMAAAVFQAALPSERLPLAQVSETKLFSEPDESSPLAGSVKEGDVLSPMAETLDAGGAKWYLVRTKEGSVGWIKSGDSAESKKLESFFKSLPNESAPIGPVTLPPPPGTLPSGAITVPIVTTGSSVVVPVTLNNSLRAHLVLDTGATYSMVSTRIARSLALHNIGYMTAVTVGGPVTRPVARLQSLKAGAAEVKDLSVGVHDIHPQVEGLLGLDFLNHFHVSLDAKKQLLVLTPR